MPTFKCSYPEYVNSKSRGRIEFHPESDASHRRMLERKLSEYRQKHPEAADAELESIDAENHVAILIDRSVASVTGDDKYKSIALPAKHCKPSAGPEAADYWSRQFPGWHMTEFHPYEGRAVMERLDTDQVRARAILAEKLKVNPWDIRVDHADDGGWHCQLGAGIVYQPSKHDKPLDEACVMVGRLGWFFQADPKTGIIDIHPGDPASFPKLVDFPFDRLGDSDTRDRMPFGIQLARPDETAKPAIVDWTQSLGLLVAGLAGGGKSVTINDIITMSVAADCELYIMDHAVKSTDFYWCRGWVTPGGWGADSLVQTCGLLRRLLDDISTGGARARAWQEHGWQNWYDDLSDEDKRKHPIRMIVIDELSQLAVGGKDATSIPKNPLPAVMDRMLEQQIISLNLSMLIKLLQIGRAYGYRFVVATQVASSSTGMPPALRGNLGNKLIMGARVNENQKNLIFNVPRDVPDIPDNVIQEGVSKGAGMAEFEGQPAFDFKTAFPVRDGLSGTAALGAALIDRVGLPDGFSRAEYLDSLDKNTPSNPDFERRIMDRIRFPESETYERIPWLQALKDKRDEAYAEFGGGSAPSEPAEPTEQPEPSHVRPAGSGSTLMDASELARLMRG